VEVVSPAPRDLWQAALDADAQSLADHAPAWTDAVCTDRWREASRAYVLPDGRTAVLPLVRRPGLPWYASNPPGWGYGGLVGPAARDPHVVSAVLDDLRGLGALTLRVRPLPGDATLWPDGIRKRAHVVDLRDGPEAAFARMRRSVRRYVRHGFDVTRGDLDAYERLWRLSVDRWAKRQGEPLVLGRRRAQFRDPPARLRALAAHLGEDFQVWIAWVDGQPVAGNVVVYGRSAHATRAAMDPDRAPQGVMQHLDWLGMEEACARGCPTMHLGESGTSSSLAFYKEGLGAVPHDYAEVRIERVPLTAADRAARTAVKRLIGFKG